MKTLILLSIISLFAFSSYKSQKTPQNQLPAISKDSAQKLLEIIVHDDPWNDSTRRLIKMTINAGADTNTRYGSVYWTLLMGAVVDGNSDLVKFLIEHGSDIETSDADGSTPLLEACYKSNVEMVKLLLKKGAKVNPLDNFGRTPWDLTNSEEIHKLLKAKGGKSGEKK